MEELGRGLPPKTGSLGWPRRLFREPMVHFLAIGLAVFLLYGQRTEVPAHVRIR